MIKVLRIINRFNLGGPTYNATFLSAFIGEDFETKLCGGQHEKHEGDSMFIPLQYGLEPVIIDVLERNINFSNDRKALKKIRKLIREYKPDIVHTHASKSGALGRYAAYKEKVPVVVHTFHGHVFHSYFGPLKTGIYKIVERYLAKKSDAIIAISPIQKGELVNKYKIADEKKVRVIPLGFDLDRFQADRANKRIAFRNEYEVALTDIAIGIVGRLAPIKNHVGFIQSIDQMAQVTTKRVVVFVVGDGELRKEIEEQANAVAQKNENLRFVFTSWVKDVDRILPGFDIVALSSLNEGTPVSLIEAQAAGVPVISTNVGGVKDILLDNVTGLVVEEFEVESYTKGLLDLVENEEKREKMSQNGWNHVRDKFHYKRLCKDVKELYVELLKKKTKNDA
ncbi:MAG: glycosyltransferase involved in cell wall biosynthesis [Crocinitomix sp.]|jgi:glycosyltransferase involved in cell wall biosynthesis